MKIITTCQSHFLLLVTQLIEETKMKNFRNITFAFIVILASGQTFAQTKKIAKNSETELNFTAQLNFDIALQLVQKVKAAAKAAGKEVSVAIVDVAGQTILLSKGDGVGPHNTEAARRKAFTSASTKTATLKLGRDAKTNPDTQNLANLPELLLLGGGSPLYYKDQLIGAVGVAGGGGAEGDDTFSKAAVLPEYSISTK